MTCIVAYIEKDKVYIGGDSAGIAGYSLSVRKDPKVFINGNFIFGFTSSFRMGQLLMTNKFSPASQKESETDYHYMITSFIDAVIERFKEGGFLSKENEVLTGGTFLVGYKGKLYEINEDFQVAESFDNFNAVGCGHDIAKGAMHILDTFSVLTPKEKIIKSLEAANRFSAGVSAPFNVLSL